MYNIRNGMDYYCNLYSCKNTELFKNKEKISINIHVYIYIHYRATLFLNFQVIKTETSHHRLRPNFI